MGYGTAAINLDNGTSQPIARIEGSSKYKELLLGLYHGPQRREWRNMGTKLDKMLYLLSRIRRFLKKQLGRPANQQTSILADMVSQLKAVSESALEHTISRAVLTFIDAARLPTEEINDIFDYQMRNLIVQPGGGYRFYAASAAYAGLCQSYTKPYECEKEELEFSEIFLHLDFSDAALSMTRVRLTKAVNWEAMRATVIPYLGFAMTQQGEQVLFDNVKERIRIFVQKNIPPVTLLILTGTAASDWRFIDTVKDALQDLVSVETLESFSAHVQMTSNTDLVFATAKGAAEAAKRSQEGLIKCDWIDKCKKKFGKLRNCIKVERMEL